MAKRPSSRSKAAEPESPAQPKAKRARAAAAGKPAPPAKLAAEPSVDDIRRRAYERYIERGGNHGMHFNDWIEAEKELRSRK